MSDIEIVKVEARRDFREFTDLPWSVYSGSDNWVPPLKTDFARLLDPRKHPFWKFAQRELFLARKNGRPVGRIVAIVDGNYNRYQNELMGIWGFFECENDDEIAGLLFKSAEEWTKSQGMRFMRGPLSPSTNYEAGLLVEGFDHMPSIMMPWNFPYYEKLVVGAGYAKEKDLFTYRVHQTDPVGSRIDRLAKHVIKKGHVSIRNVSRKTFDSDIRLLASLYNEAWADNWGFTPMSEDEVKEMGRNLKRVLEEELLFFILYDGEPVGVMMVLPDMNPVLKQANGRLGFSTGMKVLLRRRFTTGLRAAMGGVLKRYKRLGIPLVMFHYLNNLLRGHKRINFMELGWMLEDNKDVTETTIEMGAKKSAVYRIYRKSLT